MLCNFWLYKFSDFHSYHMAGVKSLYKSQLGFGAPKSEVSLYTRSDLNNIMVPVWFGNIFYITAITLSKYTYYLTKQCLLSEMRIDLSIKIIRFYYITLHLLQRCSPNLTYTTCPARWMTFMVIGKVCKFLFWMNYCFKPFNFLCEIFLCSFLGKKKNSVVIVKGRMNNRFMLCYSSCLVCFYCM